MNATERDQLQQFLRTLRQTRADPKDATADSLIREAIQAQADAPYLLVQRAMGLDLAIAAAQTRIQTLEAQCAQQSALLAQHTGHQAAPALAKAASHSDAPTSAWGRGIRVQMAATAAGVMAGGWLFQGGQSLMGHQPPSPEASEAGDTSWELGDDWA